MRRFPTLALSACALLVFGAPIEAQAQDTPTDVVTNAQLLRPGDVIRLEIWREPDWSGDFEVDEAGSVIFPRVGEYLVLGESPASLQAKLLRDFGQYLRAPNIDVTVLKRIRIIGSVNDPGLKLIDPTMSVLDALAVAGGATALGDPDQVRLMRNGQEVAVNIGTNTRILDSPIQSGDQLFVPERSWVSRNAGVVAAGITATASLIIALFIR